MVEKPKEFNGNDRLARMKSELIKELGPDVVEGPGFSNPSEIIRILNKTQMHLLRTMTCEFLFHHIILNINNINQSQVLL